MFPKKCRKLLFLLSVIVMALLCACDKKDEEKSDNPIAQAETGKELKTVKIGGIAPLSGDAFNYGSSAKNGAELAVETYNSKNKNVQLELSFKDDHADKKNALQAYKELKSEGTDVIVGPLMNDCASFVKEESEGDDVVHIIQGATAPNLTDGIRHFRICRTNLFEGKAAADYLKQKGVNYIALLHDSSEPYSEQLHDAFREEYEAIGGTVVIDEYFAKGDTDFSKQTSRLKLYKFDAIYMPVFYTQAIGLISAINNAGISTKYYGSDSWYGIAEQVEGNNSLTEGVSFFSRYIPEEESEQNKQFVSEYTKKYGQAPDIYAASTYDAVMLAAQAAEECNGNVTANGLSLAIKKINFEGLTGKMTFLSDGEPRIDPKMVTVSKGKYLGSI
ncbi:MAG TPA: hypothetical protein DCG28_00745 [Lachnospiraceae bacterium]|nr:hypothetical protein [Lachnospiraceae bacterium]